MGSEMCIRDRRYGICHPQGKSTTGRVLLACRKTPNHPLVWFRAAHPSNGLSWDCGDLPWQGIDRRRERSLLVWIVIAATVTKVVEGCAYLRMRFYAIFGMLSGEEFEHSVLRSPLSSLSSNTTTTNKLIRPRGGQGIRAWTLQTHW